MRPSDFKRWRKALGLSQKQAADALGLRRRIVQYYEKGERDGEKVSVPKTVRLACYALTSGIADYHGPDARPEAEKGGGFRVVGALRSSASYTFRAGQSRR